MQARNNLIRRLAGSSWGASTDVLRSSSLALCYSTAEYCAPVWSRSVHTKRVDTALNNSMRLVSGAIKSTPTSQLPLLSGITPPDIRRLEQCLKLLHRSTKTPTHLLHHLTTTNREQPTSRLKSRYPLSRQLHELQHEAINTSPETWSQDRWSSRWQLTDCQLRRYIPTPTNKPPGHDLPRAQWVQLNRLRSGHGRYKAFMHRIGLADTNLCPCGEVQTSAHVLQCTLIGMNGDLATVDNDFRTWLQHSNTVF